MGTRLLLLLCVAAATLFTVCQSCTVGREFLTTFLPNYRWGQVEGQKLQLVIAAQGSAAKVTIKADKARFTKTLNLSPNQHTWVRLPNEAQLLRTGGYPNSAVRISSSADITVVSFNSGDKSGDGTVVQPIYEQGVDYVVFTPPFGPNNFDKVVAVVNGDSPNRISFTPFQSVKLRRSKEFWGAGKNVNVALKPYETYLVKSGTDLTGMRVRSQKPVAVLVGHTCLKMVQYCEHVFEQLPPVSELGKEYMVPSMGRDDAKQHAYIVAAEDGDTEVVVEGKRKFKLHSGQSMKVLIQAKHPVVVKATKKVLMMFLSDNRPHDPFLTTLVPSSGLSDAWALDTEGRLTSYAVLLAEKEGSDSVCVRGGGGGSGGKGTKGTNLARAGVATQSSIYRREYSPKNAIDGSRASNAQQGSLTHTGNDYRPWWRVDLRTAYKVNKVTVTNRKDCCASRLNGAEIRIGNSLSDNGNRNQRCAVIHIGAGVTKTYNCGGMTGRYVNIVIPGRKEYLTLAEVEVYGQASALAGGKCSVPTWRAFPADANRVWSKVPLGDKQSHVTVEGDAPMAVYVYGGMHMRGYATTGVCFDAAVTKPPPTLPPDPCDGISCHEKEKCVKGVCVHTSTETCRATGDPHYRTFDGRTYDFQGTCSYVMSTLAKKIGGLTAFTVTTKNNHRGNRRVSYVRTVTVSVYGHTITINSQRGKVKVNGELVYLPVSLSGGKVSVKRSGSYAVLTTDFSLNVKYDWNSRIYITVPSSYYRHLGGLCGNYNGDRKDDLPKPTGSQMPIVLQMIKQWKVKDSDRFCNDNCGGRCPSCSPKQQTHYKKPSLCGVLTQKDGPFSACHTAVDPAMYLDNCVYDVCINKGARQFLCDNLKDYNDVCLSQGVKVNPQWRMIANCPLSCPAGSHYEACGSACPSSCGSLDTEKQCRARCVEGCQCDKGRVLSGDKCVPTSSCGCQHQGSYHPPGTTFWGDNTCNTKCSCDRGKAECIAAQCKKNTRCSLCKKNERCAMKGGVRNCYPVSFATCYGQGDPHYRTFDRRRFDFQGTCTYVLSQLVKGSDPDLVPFQVLVQNENRGRNKAVSYTKSVSITVYNNTIKMSSDNPGKVLVNGRTVNLPYSTPDEELSISRRGYYGVVQAAFGLKLKFNWKSTVMLTLPSTYSNAVSGLCGNYNKNGKDDFQKPDGSQAKDPNTFGASWKAGGGPGCKSECVGGKCPKCEPAMAKLYQKRQYCGIISDQAGPFKQCHAKLDHTEYLHDCLYDMCMYKGHASALCGSLSAFSTACQEAGATVETWRTKDFCPPSCGPNSHYETCPQTCPQTCSGLVSPRGCEEEEEEAGVCTEACVCDDGFVLSDDTCVPVAECGCQYEGQYYHKGQVFRPSCGTRCKCQANGQMSCKTDVCSANEKCAMVGGVASCVPTSIGSCSVGGARTVRSFDGQVYSLRGDCVFTLSEVKERTGGRAAFSVLLHQNTEKDGSVSRSAEVEAYAYNIYMGSGVIGEVKLDDIRTSLPLSLANGKVSVYQNGINTVVETDFGLTVTYDSIAGVVVQLPSTYRGAPRGLCGDYNGKSSDDFVLANQAKPAPLEAFAAAWSDAPCKTGCGKTGDAPCPTPVTPTGIPIEKDVCDIIRARKGPFAGCHAVVPPRFHYDSCVTDVAAGGGGGDVLCRHIQAYVSSCQSAGATVTSWRTAKLCPLRCPAGSHYELCADTCSSSCSYLLSPRRCPLCHEGCQCDEGLAFDGGRCVPVEKCGCMADGVYYKSGVPVLRDDCSESCECQSGRFSCKKHSCQKGEQCAVKDGYLRCYSTDPCVEEQCREKERCEVQGGEAVCVAQSKAVCWAFGDPHYSTFDGFSFSFQGTCSYVLVNTTGRDPTLPEVTVTTKNELRGNDVGSFLRSASVDILGHRITIIKGHHGTVDVDGVRTGLPVQLEDGSISITDAAGGRGRLLTDVGVEVAFDWNTLLMVTLSSSFHGNVGGLCGNYNDDASDERATPTGALQASVEEWAGSWSVPDGDAFCHHHCSKGRCPKCSTQDKLRYSRPEFCGVLANEKGPFSGCHGKVPVKQFAQDCLYDVCLNDGRQEVLCEALTNYVAECQEAGGSVLQWRGEAKCPLSCPANSHYDICGAACPETCGARPLACHKGCVESCVCDKGYVLSGEKCVKKEKCGCNHDGRYYLPGEVFWADKQCRSKCLCNKATKKVQCEPWGCKAGEHCSVVDGVQDCYPVTFHTCQAQGDPHFKTFDGRKFDFQGNCAYRLSGVCKNKTGLEPFEVRLENNNRGSTKVSYAKVVTVKVSGETYVLSLDHPGKVVVNGLAEYLPFSSENSLVHVRQSHRSAVLETHFLRVSYDFSSTVRVKVADRYKDALCGLCGNFNGRSDDDLLLPDGKPASSATQFGVSQWLYNVPGCSHQCKDCAPPLPPGFKPPGYTKACDVIVSKDGPLRDCVSRVDAARFHSDCIYDMVQTNGKQAPACVIIADYVQECQEAGGKVQNWRTKNFCWMKCPANSEYTLSAPACPATCADPNPTGCSEPASEGCVCKRGYHLSQDRCVRLSACGCRFEGRYVPTGKKFYADADCRRHCVCFGGLVTCWTQPCPWKKKCGIHMGTRVCHQETKTTPPPRPTTPIPHPVDTYEMLYPKKNY